MVQIKQKGVYGVENPLPRSFLGGVVRSEHKEKWGLGSRPNKMYGERLGDGVEYHLMSPTPRR